MHPKEGHWKFRGGRAGSQGKYEAKLEFPAGSLGGSNQKNLLWVWINFLADQSAIWNFNICHNIDYTLNKILILFTVM